jgi:hypothetical protein
VTFVIRAPSCSKKATARDDSPSSAVRGVAEDDPGFDVPVAGVLGVEGHVAVASPDAFPGLRQLVDDVGRQQRCETRPVPPVQPVRERRHESFAIGHETRT